MDCVEQLTISIFSLERIDSTQNSKNYRWITFKQQDDLSSILGTNVGIGTFFRNIVNFQTNNIYYVFKFSWELFFEQFLWRPFWWEVKCLKSDHSAQTNFWCIMIVGYYGMFSTSSKVLYYSNEWPKSVAKSIIYIFNIQPIDY